jgi:hypothetical protein
LREKSQLPRILTLFFIPIIASAIYILMMYWLMPDDLFKIIGLLLLTYFIAPFGREVLIPIAVVSLMQLHGTGQMGLDIFMIVATIVFVDVMCSIFLLWNLDLLKLVPKLGNWIDGIENFGRARLRKSKWKRLGMFVFLIGYDALPFQGTNGAASTLIGLLAGMKKARIWLTIWIGSIIGALVIAVVAFSIGQYLIDTFSNSSYKVVTLLVTSGILIYLVLNYYRHRQRKAVSKN